MRPIDFVVFSGDSSPNRPVHEIAEAMGKNIRIYCNGEKVHVLSYYYDEERKRMTLEVGDE